MRNAVLSPSGEFHAVPLRRVPTVAESVVASRRIGPGPSSVLVNGTDMLRYALKHGLPRMSLEPEVRRWRTRNMRHLARGLRTVAAARALRIPTFYGDVWMRKIFGDGRVLDYGVASLRLVTNNGVAFIVDAFQNILEAEIMNFHGIGTGTNAEAQADSALQTELTTEYNPNSTRATGTQSEPAANQYRSVGTNTLDSGTPAITEHGLFSQAATAGGVLFDRSVFSAINLTGANGDSLQSTYTVTFPAGG